MMMMMGLTCTAQMSRALPTGIQQLARVMCALFANENVGAAMRATTAGRMPRNMLSTTALSSNCLKNMAMASIIRNDGRAVASVMQNAPFVLRRRYPTNVLMFIAITPGQL